MSEKIKSLTIKQINEMPAYVDKWINIGIATGPIDIDASKKAVISMYKNVGLPAPRNFLTAQSPIDAVKKIKSLFPNMSPSRIFNDMYYNNHESPWMSFYDYFMNVVDISNIEVFSPIIELSKHCGWVSLYEDVVIFQDRPMYIKFDDMKRLHCENGPSILYSDGFAIYSWHGVAIPSEWIEHKLDLTPKIALTWKNLEQRRCACEILGWARILRELNSRVIDSDDDPMIGNLLEVNIPDIGNEKFLQVLCGTGRTFAIPVPPECKTALEANAWTFNIDPQTLRDLEVRT